MKKIAVLTAVLVSSSGVPLERCIASPMIYTVPPSTGLGVTRVTSDRESVLSASAETKQLDSFVENDGAAIARASDSPTDYAAELIGEPVPSIDPSSFISAPRAEIDNLAAPSDVAESESAVATSDNHANDFAVDSEQASYGFAGTMQTDNLVQDYGVAYAIPSASPTVHAAEVIYATVPSIDPSSYPTAPRAEVDNLAALSDAAESEIGSPENHAKDFAVVPDESGEPIAFVEYATPDASSSPSESDESSPAESTVSLATDSDVEEQCSLTSDESIETASLDEVKVAIHRLAEVAAYISKLSVKMERSPIGPLWSGTRARNFSYSADSILEHLWSLGWSLTKVSSNYVSKYNAGNSTEKIVERLDEMIGDLRKLRISDMNRGTPPWDWYLTDTPDQFEAMAMIAKEIETLRTIRDEFADTNKLVKGKNAVKPISFEGLGAVRVGAETTSDVIRSVFAVAALAQVAIRRVDDEREADVIYDRLARNLHKAYRHLVSSRAYPESEWEEATEYKNRGFVRGMLAIYGCATRIGTKDQQATYERIWLSIWEKFGEQ